MHERFISLLCCPSTGHALALADAVEEGGQIKSGSYVDGSGTRYPIVDFIPRFVPVDNYASNFGLEWQIHANTQHDPHSRQELSERRFREETKWSRDLRGQLVLEAGCGAGRFTRYPLDDGATVVCIDYSSAIDVCYRHHGQRDALMVQADICALPFAPETFDKVFCFGVLQHTPDPERSFHSLCNMLKPGGDIAIDVYVKDLLHWLLHTKYYVRPITRRMDPQHLYRLVRGYVNLMWPMIRLIRRIPYRVGQGICWRLLVADHSSVMNGASDNLLREWAHLDTFDMLSPRHDLPQRLSTVKRWFDEGGLIDAEVHKGWNGLEGRGKRPSVSRPASPRGTAGL